jgi:hypothetical protein
VTKGAGDVVRGIAAVLRILDPVLRRLVHHRDGERAERGHGSHFPRMQGMRPERRAVERY